MLNKYPEYKRGEIEKLYEKLSKKDKESLENFLLVCRTSANENKVKDIKRSVLQLSHITHKEFDNIELNDLRHFLVLLNQSNKEDWSKHDIKAHIKRFLKYHFKDWSERFNELKEIKNNSVGMNQKKINSKTLLTKAEIETIMNKEKDLVKKTFFICLFETGMRPSELRTMKWSSIKFNVDEDLSEFDIFMSKNKKHKVVYVKQGTFYLKKLQQISNSDYIFCSRENKDLPIIDSTAHRWIADLGKHIAKKIYPYLIRHSRAQELYQLVDEGKLSERVVQRTLGHSKSMRDIYSELDSKTLKEAVTKTIYKIEELPQEKEDSYKKEIDNLKKNNEIYRKTLRETQDIIKIMAKHSLNIYKHLGVTKNETLKELKAITE